MKKQVLAIIVLFVITALGQSFANEGDAISTIRNYTHRIVTNLSW